MGLYRKLYIDQKLFEFKRENVQWWRIMESSRRVTAMDWVAPVVVTCGASVSFSGVFRTCRKGNQI